MTFIFYHSVEVGLLYGHSNLVYYLITLYFRMLVFTICKSQDARVRILVQVTIYRRLLIGRDGHLDQSEAYDIS